MLFRLPDLRAAEMRPLIRWFRRGELLRPVYNLYLSAIPTQTPRLEFRFLALAQALDAYYHRKHPGPWRKLRYVVKALEGELPHAFRKRIPTGFAQLVEDTRHYFTHWNPMYEQKAAKGDDLVSLVFGVKVLTELVLLAELGWSKTESFPCLTRTQRVVSTVHASFDRL